MPKPKKRLKPDFDAVRFELDQLLTDNSVRWAYGFRAPVKNESVSNLWVWSVVPMRRATAQVTLEDYPKLYRFLRVKSKWWTIKDLINVFILRVLRERRDVLKDHLAARTLRAKIRPGGCISFDSGPDKKYKHITFGVPRVASRSDSDHS